ncbi:hypothetical protein ACLMJK_005687 [Lecanora helva]
MENGGNLDIASNVTAPVILTNVEINVAILCACLPTFGPIWTYILGKVIAWRSRRRNHKRGLALLMDMLPQRRRTAPLPPQVQRESQHGSGLGAPQNQNVVPDMIEVEAQERPLPEIPTIERRPTEMQTNEFPALELPGIDSPLNSAWGLEDLVRVHQETTRASSVASGDQSHA